MHKLNLDDHEVGLVQPGNIKDRYRITIEVIVEAESIDDAQQEVKDLIEYGILALIDQEEREAIDEWDITEAEPAEVL